MANQAENSIFREKSMDRVTSPEALNDYIRVTTPSVWIILAALVSLLAGMIIWSVIGTVKVQKTVSKPNEDQSGTIEVTEIVEIEPIHYLIN
jgi:hypothetical protein